ncbi:MAG: NFACT family protein [Thermoplasmata archaeon]|uniref:NFACT family protein n=1 Tax=Candidatus Sysuiplasma superficiale TaxID=2823368 RepID=A0A8J7YT36_9ARCH|nr:NFACT family protein [Candidatus Sysuiplasma superficiale]MBX8643632.1 NFACT family protein [Candidatus Sysuiplasma superficiale]MCL4347247.1 NFACT family protein [Candidatus Thermoplasmatota archaeon]
MRKTKSSMTSLDAKVMSKELKSLTGSYAEKAYGGNPFSIRFNTQTSKRELLLMDGLFLALSDRIERNGGTEIGEFAGAVRRKFDNSRVLSVTQNGFDRIIRIAFSRPEGSEMIFELLGKGNVLIVENGMITAAMRTDRRGNFEAKPGRKYEAPSQRFNPIDSSDEQLKELLRSSRGDTVRTLATIAGLGPDLAEEVCERTSIERERRPSDLSDDEIGAINRTIMDIVSSALERPDPVVYYKGEAAVQFTPVPFRIFSSLDARKYDSLSSAIIGFIRDRKIEAVNADEERYARLIRRQQEQIERFRADRDAARAFASSIYEDYPAFEKMIQSIRKGKETAFSYRKTSGGKVAISVGTGEIEIDPSMEPNTIASMIYDGAKEIERKLRRAEEALAEIIRNKPEAVPEARKIVIKKAIRRFWFEQYRWFVSSEGCLIVGGRDAKTNDRLVSKHLSPGDRYAHADIYGAPSVVVKWKEGATEKTLEEACTFAVCFSRAWNSKIGAASAYWVMPEQVSKTPQTGEFLPRGAFVIRGRRNYFNKLKLELVLGKITYEGETRLVCAPESAMSQNSTFYVRVIPGNRTKENLAAELADKLDVGRDEIVSVLPPGTSDIAGAPITHQTKE